MCLSGSQLVGGIHCWEGVVCMLTILVWNFKRVVFSCVVLVLLVRWVVVQERSIKRRVGAKRAGGPLGLNTVCKHCCRTPKFLFWQGMVLLQHLG